MAQRQMTHSEKFLINRMEKYPTLQVLAEYGENFKKASRSLVIMDALIRGQRSDYDDIVAAQDEDEKLTFESFERLHGYFYPFRFKPELREVLEIYIIAKNFARSERSRKLLRNLPKEHRKPAFLEEAVLSFIQFGILPELEKLSLYQIETFRNALKYRVSVSENIKVKAKATDFSDSEQLIALVSCVCDVAGIAGQYNITGSLTLTEEVAGDILFLIENSKNPLTANTLFSRTDTPVGEN